MANRFAEVLKIENAPGVPGSQVAKIKFFFQLELILAKTESLPVGSFVHGQAGFTRRSLANLRPGA
jgi:hypothetical protein